MMMHKTPDDVIRWLRSENDDLFNRYADAIERLQNERTFWHQKWRRDWQALQEATAKVKRLEHELAAEKTLTDWQNRQIAKEEIRLTEEIET